VTLGCSFALVASIGCLRRVGDPGRPPVPLSFTGIAMGARLDLRVVATCSRGGRKGRPGIGIRVWAGASERFGELARLFPAQLSTGGTADCAPSFLIAPGSN